jgi:hypothetical protein
MITFEKPLEMPLTAEEKEKLRIMEDDINNISGALKDLKVQFFELKMKFEQVYFAIIGSDLTKDGGIIKRVSDTEAIIKIWDKKMKFVSQKNNALMVVIGGVAAFFLKVIWDIITKK